MTLTSGSGIIITPNSASNIGGSSFSGPGLKLPISSIIPNFTTSMPLRMWIYIPTDTAAANFDSIYFGTYVNPSGQANQYTIGSYKGFGGGTNGWGGLTVLLNSTITFTSPAVNPSTNKVGIMTYPAGVIGSVAPLTTATTVSGGVWPAINTHTLATSTGVSAASSTAISSATSGSHPITDLNFFISGIRSGSGTAYSATIARFRVDYLPTLN
jgi:hypothetical protein